MVHPKHWRSAALWADYFYHKDKKWSKERMANIEAFMGQLTTEETKHVLAKCIENLTDTDVFEVLDEKLSEQDKGELVEMWCQDAQT